MTDYESIDETKMDTIVKVPDIPERKLKHIQETNHTKLPESDENNTVKHSVERPDTGNYTMDGGSEIAFTDDKPSDEYKSENCCSRIKEQPMESDVANYGNDGGYEIPYTKTIFILQNNDDDNGGNGESMRKPNFNTDPKLLTVATGGTQDRCTQIVAEGKCVNIDLFHTTAKTGSVEAFDVAERTGNKADCRNTCFASESHVIWNVPVGDINVDCDGYEIPFTILEPTHPYFCRNMPKQTTKETKQANRSNVDNIENENIVRPRVGPVSGDKVQVWESLSRKGIGGTIDDTDHQLPPPKESISVDDDGYEIPHVS